MVLLEFGRLLLFALPEVESSLVRLAVTDWWCKGVFVRAQYVLQIGRTSMGEHLLVALLEEGVHAVHTPTLELVESSQILSLLIVHKKWS